jgi:hypothetical protein
MMGVLTPLFLLAGVAALIPLILHLFHRQDRQRLVFPALRYLQRMKKDHARKIRLRQLLLLILRMSAILLLVLAGSRPFLKNNQGMHEPTATVIILDNSMSSGFVREGRQILDSLKEMALQGVEASSDQDRLWLIKAAEPWVPATTGSSRDIQEAILNTRVTQTSSNILTELERAAAILSSSDLPLKEIHLISDLQESAFVITSKLEHIEDTPLIVSALELLEPNNGYLDSLVIGNGLAPLTNELSHISIRVLGPKGNTQMPVRLIIDDRISGVSNGISGSSVVLPIGPFSSNQVTGHIERDPDFLSVDDRRFFVFQVRPPTRIATSGEVPFFLSQALSVLADRARIDLHPRATAQLHISIGGNNLRQPARADLASFVVPSYDPALLPGLNRSLLDAGIPWRYQLSNTTGESQLSEWNEGPALSGVTVKRHYRLIPTGPIASGDILVRLESGSPWLVKGSGAQGPYTLIASDLNEESTSLPVTAALIPFLDWILSGRTTSTDIHENRITGDPLVVPGDIVGLIDPIGTTQEIRGGQTFNATGNPGIYQLIRSDSTVTKVAFNVPAQESQLETIEIETLKDLLPESAVLVNDPGNWGNTVFVNRKGMEIWKWLVMIALVILVAETVAAASGLEQSRENSATTPSGENP